VGQILAFLVVLGGFAVIMGGLAWLASRARSRSVGGAFMGPLDEIYNPAAHRTHIEIRAQAEQAVPMPSPDDGWPPHSRPEP
jgi:hypothetical protein